MGTTIGNNSIVGAGSVVKGTFPDNVVIAGNPGRVICSISEYYQKCKTNWIENAKTYARAIYQNSGRKPTVEEMSDGYGWLYLQRNKDNVEKYHSFFELSSDDETRVIDDFFKSKPLFDSFESFLEFCEFDKI